LSVYNIWDIMRIGSIEIQHKSLNLQDILLSPRRRPGMKHVCILAAIALLLAILSNASCCSAESAAAKITAALSSNSTPSGDEPIKVGGIFALTGAESLLDLPAAKGAELAAKEINVSGGVLGCSLELTVRDSEYKMDLASKAAEQLIEENKVVAGIGFTEPGSLLAAGPIFQAAGIPFITVGATSPKVPQQVGDMIYLACFGDNTQAAAGAEYAAKSFGKSAYLLWDNGEEYTRLLAGYFKNRFTELGGSIVLEDSFEDNATDFSMQIEKLRALPAQPDFYYIAAMPYNVGPLVKQLRAAGYDGPIVGGDGYDTPDLVRLAGDASDNVFFTTHALMDEERGTEAIKRFIASYNREYGHDPENAFAALGYDAVYLLADAIKRAGSTDPAAIQKAIGETRDFVGITGSISYTNGEHVPRKDVTIVAVRDGKLTLAAEVMPEKVPAP
jgi:branched-chain amino acid transport system substrate-binding protein